MSILPSIQHGPAVTIVLADLAALNNKVILIIVTLLNCKDINPSKHNIRVITTTIGIPTKQ